MYQVADAGLNEIVVASYLLSEAEKEILIQNNEMKLCLH